MSLFSNVKLNIRQHFLDKTANPLSVNNVVSNSLKTLNKDVFEKSSSTNQGRNSMTYADKMNILIKNKNVQKLVNDGIFDETDLVMLIDCIHCLITSKYKNYFKMAKLMLLLY